MLESFPSTARPLQLQSTKMVSKRLANPRKLRELDEISSETLSVIFENSWETDEETTDCRQANDVPIFEEGKREDLGNYRPISLTSILGKVLAQIIEQMVCDGMACLDY